MTRETARFVILILLGVNAIAALWRYGGLGREEVPVHDTVPAAEQPKKPTDKVWKAEPPSNKPDELIAIDKQAFYKTFTEGDSGINAYYCARYVTLQWPVAVNGERRLNTLHRAIIDALFGEHTDNIYIAIDNVIMQPKFPEGVNSDYVETVKSLPSNVPTGHAFRSRHVLQVYLTSDRLVEFQLRIHQCAGAATETDVHKYLVYDRLKERVLTLDDIVGDQKALLNALNRRIDQLNRRGMCLKQASRIPSFRLEPEGIHFIFPRYEVGYAADGEVTVKLPYNSITPLLTPEMKDIVINNANYSRPKKH